MQIQSNLASTIAMAFDECPSSVADRDYVQRSVARTTRWLKRCKDEMARLNSLPDTINKNQLLLALTRGLFMKISVLSMPRLSRRWIWTAMQWAALQLVKVMRRCTGSWMRWFRICRRTSRRILWGLVPRPIFWRVERGIDFLTVYIPAVTAVMVTCIPTMAR